MVSLASDTISKPGTAAGKTNTRPLSTERVNASEKLLPVVEQCESFSLSAVVQLCANFPKSSENVGSVSVMLLLKRGLAILGVGFRGIGIGSEVVFGMAPKGLLSVGSGASSAVARYSSCKKHFGTANFLPSRVTYAYPVRECCSIKIKSVDCLVNLKQNKSIT